MTFAIAKPSTFAVVGTLPPTSRRFRMALGVTEPATLTAVIVALVIVPTATGVTPIGFHNRRPDGWSGRAIHYHRRRNGSLIRALRS